MDLLDKNEPISSIQESRDAFVVMAESGIVDDGVQFLYAVDLLRTTRKEALNLSVKLLEDGLTGLAVVGGAVLGAAALLGIGLGVGLSKRR
ncbi:uncharacterized protein DC041_0001146 [Schistosoma bovis]|uniref:Mitochondrial fission 1 protein n=2 Tax=Schistosoma TaxID=6181 RepID=A0A430QBL9_SCHBO|nr:uncharacterized protein DC041_0001146 [Schistosoma bovis]